MIREANDGVSDAPLHRGHNKGILSPPPIIGTQHTNIKIDYATHIIDHTCTTVHEIIHST